MKSETDVLCNLCGGSCVSEEIQKVCHTNKERKKYLQYWIAGLQVCVWGSSHSKVLKNQTKYEFDLCEQCIGTLMNLFVISPDIKDF